jgi:Na+/proline symporter
MAGIWGIAATDLIQYVISTVGTIALAVIALQHVGGIEGLLGGLVERYGVEQASLRLQFVPRPDTSFFHVFLVFVLLKWWGNPPGAVTQRIVSSKDERHASGATLVFSLVHFALNYWPMILAALVSLVLYQNLPSESAELGYARLIVDMLPTGLLGIMLASLVAAFMSTIDTHIHLGASYMVNDIYRRFLVRGASEAHYVRISRAATVVMLIMTLMLAQIIESVRWAWEFLATMTAGYGTVVVLRWFWWRINAWGEISALVASLLLSQTCEVLRAMGWSLMEGFGHRFLVVFFGTTLIWVVVTFLTPPTDPETLVRFCRRVRPCARFWGPIRDAYPDLGWDERFGRVCLRWLLGVVTLMGVCFGTGHLLLGRMLLGVALWAMAMLGAATIAGTFRRRGQVLI